MDTAAQREFGRVVGVGRESIPWAMAAARAALGPVLIAGAACGWNPLTLGAVVVGALLSDIFDGILARRWGCDTAAVRRFDSLADTVFYICTAAALWLARPEIIRGNARLLGAVLALEGIRALFEISKFGKPASYHSYLAKAWGLVMAIAVTAAFASLSSSLIPLALGMGLLSNLEGLAMSVILPLWQHDVKGVQPALAIRRKYTGTTLCYHPEHDAT